MILVGEDVRRKRFFASEAHREPESEPGTSGGDVLRRNRSAVSPNDGVDNRQAKP